MTLGINSDNVATLRTDEALVVAAPPAFIFDAIQFPYKIQVVEVMAAAVLGAPEGADIEVTLAYNDGETHPFFEDGLVIPDGAQTSGWQIPDDPDLVLPEGASLFGMIDQVGSEDAGSGLRLFIRYRQQL